MKMDDYGVLGLFWKICVKVGEIYECSECYFKLLFNIYVFKVEVVGELFWVYLLCEFYCWGVVLFNEVIFVVMVVVL